MQGIPFTLTLAAIIALVALSNGPMIFPEEVLPKKEPPSTACEKVTGRKDRCQKAEATVVLLLHAWQSMQSPILNRR